MFPHFLEEYKFEIEHRYTKEFLKSLIFGSKFGFRDSVMMEKIPHDVGNYVSPFEMWIRLVTILAQKYPSFWVLVLLSDLNQNSVLVVQYCKVFQHHYIYFGANLCTVFQYKK